MAVYDFTGAFRNLNSAISGLGDSFEEQRKREASRAALDAAVGGDYTGAARAFGALGDVGSGLKLLEIGRGIDQQRAAGAAVASALGGGYGDLNATGPAQGAQPIASLGSPTQVETRFMSGIREAGLNNPFGLAAVAAYGKRESGFSPANANRTWADPSQSGRAGTSGGVMSWRNERLRNLYKFAQQRGEKIGAISPETQAAFLASEDPTLIPRLNATKTPEEANRIMADAWRFAGYQGNSPEYNARLRATMAYVPRFQGDANTVQRATGQQPTQVAAADAPAEGAQPAQGFAIPGQGQGQARAPMSPEMARTGMQRIEQVIAATPGLTPAQLKALEFRYNQLSRWADPRTALDLEGKALTNEKARRELDGTGRIERGLTPQFGVDANGNPVMLQIGKDGTAVQTRMPEGVSLSKEPIRIDAGTHTVLLDPVTRQQIGMVPKNIGAAEVEKATGKGIATRQLEAPQARLTLNSTFNSLDRMATEARAVRDHKGLGGITGWQGVFPNRPGGDAANAKARLATLKSQIGFSVLQAMRDASKTGGALGSVSDAEGVRLENNLAALEQSQSLEEFQKSLDQIITYVSDAKARMQAAFDETYGSGRGGGPTVQQQGAPVQVNSPQDIEALPSGATFIAPNGQLKRKP